MKKNCFITLGLVTLLGFVVIFTGCKEVSPKKPDICSFSIKSDYSEPVSIFILKSDSQNFSYFDIVEHHIIKPNSTTNITTIANPKDTSWGFGWYNGRISAGSLSFWIDAKPSINSKGQLTCIFDGEIDVFPDTLRLYEENQEEIQISVTANEVPEKIANMYGKNKITVTGECNTNQIIEIGKALIENNSAEIILDLSGTTGLTEIPSRTFAESYSLVEIILPDSVTEIGEGVFVGCRYLKKVENLENISILPRIAFAWCENLESIKLSSNIKDIGENVFIKCPKLTDINIDSNSFIVENGAIYTADKTTLIAYPAAKDRITIPSSVTKISDWALSGSLIEKITIPATVNYIGSGTFGNCNNLKSVEILGNISIIPDQTFYNCEKLESITIPASVTEIGGNSFYNCTLLTSITYSGTEKMWNYIVIEKGNEVLDNVNITYKNEVEEIPLEVVTVTASNAYSTIASLSGLVKVVVEGSCSSSDITEIGEALRNNSDARIILDLSGTTGLTKIPEWAFEWCNSLLEISLPDSVTEIGESAFRGCGLRKVANLGNISTIPFGCFWGCGNLESIIIPESVTSIEECVFVGCSKLTDINFEGNNFIVEDGAIYSKDKTILVAFPTAKGNITIPDSISKIIGGAFGGTLIENITLPSTIKIIERDIFRDCHNLKTVEILGEIPTIPLQAFDTCENLESITIPASVTEIGGGAFYNCTSLTSVTYSGTEEMWNEILIEEGNEVLDNVNITYKNEVEEIPLEVVTVTASNAYSTIASLSGRVKVVVEGSCSSSDITEISEALRNNSSARIILDLSGTTGLTEIPEWAFEQCYSLVEISLPDSVTKIGGGAFCDCSNLQKVCNLGSITSINYSSFSWCRRLKSITIPSSVTNIDDGAFVYCINLTDINIEGNNFIAEDGAIYTSDKTTLIAYSTASGDVIIDNSVTKIGDSAFCHSDITSITIPNSVTEIGENAFSNSSLKTVKSLGSITSIPAYCFSACRNLESITIPASVTEIGGAFGGCLNLTDINIEGNNFIYEDGVIYTSDKTTLVAFPSAIGNITITDTVTNINDRAFNVTNITSITIPSTVDSIGEGVFRECSNLKSVEILGNITMIPNDTFCYCENLESITIPASVTEIGWAAFRYCTSLTSITYSGTEEMWNEIYIEGDNEVLNNMNITFLGEVSN